MGAKDITEKEVISNSKERTCKRTIIGECPSRTKGNLLEQKLLRKYGTMNKRRTSHCGASLRNLGKLWIKKRF